MRAISHDAATLQHTRSLKKLFSVVVSALLALSLLPVGAFAYAGAAEGSDTAAESQGVASEGGKDRSGAVSETGSTSAAAEADSSSHGQLSSQGGSLQGGSSGTQAATQAENGSGAQGSSGLSGEEGASTQGSLQSTASDSAVAGSSSAIGGSAAESGSSASGVSGLAPTQSEGDAASNSANTVTVSAAVYGIDANGADQTWAAGEKYELPEGSTAADLFEAMLKKTGLQASYDPEGEYGLSISTITSPIDPSLSPGWDEATKHYWQFFYNGKASDLGPSLVELHSGDTVVWYYSAFGDNLPASEPPLAEEPSGEPDDTVSVSGWLVGVNAEGEDETWIPMGFTSLPVGSTAADLTEFMIEATGIEAEIYTPEVEGYWMLNAVTSPNDPDLILTYDPVTRAFWQLFINGEFASVGADQYTLEDGDLITWYYGADGTMPDFDSGEGDGDEGDDGLVDGVAVDKDAARPTDWEAQWPGFGGTGAVEDVKTPTSVSDDAWSVQLKDPDDYNTYVSDPIVVNNRVYVAAGNTLCVYDAKTGNPIIQCRLVAPIDSVARMVYADGLVIVPVEGGRLQAITADELITVWMTDELSPIDSTGTQQSLCTLTVEGGYVYYATASAAFSGATNSGYVVCVSLKDGTVQWSNANSTVGYYWAGASVQGQWVVIGDDAGDVSVLNARTGELASKVQLGTPVRSTIVEGTQENTLLAVASNGQLFKLAIDPGTGVINVVQSVQFGNSSTSTPTVYDGTVYVGGASLESPTGNGVLVAIDEASMTVTRTIAAHDGGLAFAGDIKSTPLVCKQSSGTYVYFTCNDQYGAAYCYRVGDAEAYTIYMPDEDHRNYTMASIVCGADGTLYYINDSGALFAIAGGGIEKVEEEEEIEKKEPSTPVTTTSKPSPNLFPPSVRSSVGGSGGTAPENADDIPVSAASSEVAKALASDASASIEDDRPGVPAWLPIAGIAVGACGLVAVAVIAVRLARRG